MIVGNDGNDRLFGGAGVDRIVGGAGDDALHGGSVTAADVLVGNAGADRFLRQDLDVIEDRGTGDAVIEFENYSDLWNDVEIEVMDQAFQQLYDATQNNILLVDTLSTDDLRFLKYDSLGNYAGTNWLQTSTSWYYENGNLITNYTYSREIRIADWDETSSWYNDQYQLVALHEIGHNWDSELELTTVSSDLGTVWNSFLAASGWTDSNPNDSNHTQSLNGQWWYDNNASFAEYYGRTNPNEDAATMFEYLMSTDSGNFNSDLQSKLDIYTAVVDFLKTPTSV